MTKTTLPRKSTRIATAVSLLTVLLMSAPATAANNADINQIDLYKEWLANQYGAIPVYDAQSNNWTLKPLVRSMQTYGLLSRGHSSYDEVDRTYFGGNALENPYDPTKSLVPTEEKEKKKFKKAKIPISEGGSALGILKRPINVVQGTDIVIPIRSVSIDPINLSITKETKDVSFEQPTLAPVTVKAPARPAQKSYSSPQITNPTVEQPTVPEVQTVSINVSPVNVSEPKTIQISKPKEISTPTVPSPTNPPLLSFPNVSEPSAPNLPEIKPTIPSPKQSLPDGANPNSPYISFGPDYSGTSGVKGYFQDVSLLSLKNLADENGHIIFNSTLPGSINWEVQYNTNILGFNEKEKLIGKLVDGGYQATTSYNKTYPTDSTKPIIFNYKEHSSFSSEPYLYVITSVPYAQIGDPKREKPIVIDNLTSGALIDNEVEDQGQGSFKTGTWTPEKFATLGILTKNESLDETAEYSNILNYTPFNLKQIQLFRTYATINLNAEKSIFLMSTVHSNSGNRLVFIENHGEINLIGAGSRAFLQTPDSSGPQYVVYHNAGTITVNAPNAKNDSPPFVFYITYKYSQPNGLVLNTGAINLNSPFAIGLIYSSTTENPTNYFSFINPITINSKGAIGIYNPSTIVSNLASQATETDPLGISRNYANIVIADGVDATEQTSIGVFQSGRRTQNLALRFHTKGNGTIGVIAQPNSGLNITKKALNPLTNAPDLSTEYTVEKGNHNIGLYADNSTISYQGDMNILGGENNTFAYPLNSGKIFFKTGTQIKAGKDENDRVLTQSFIANNGTISFEGSSVNIYGKNASTGLFANGANATISSDNTSTIKIDIKGEGDHTALVAADKGGKITLGNSTQKNTLTGTNISSILFAGEGSTITLNNTDVNVHSSEGHTTTGAYTKGGRIELKSSDLNLYGASIAYNLEKQTNGEFVASVKMDENSHINVFSNEVVIFNFPDTPEKTLKTNEVTGTSTTIGGVDKPNNIIPQVDPATNKKAENYTLAAFSRPSLTLDNSLTYTDTDESGKTFYNNIVIQKGRIQADKDVTLQLGKETLINNLGGRLVGLYMTSTPDIQKLSDNESSWIHVSKDTTVTVDRLSDVTATSAGLYTNYANIINNGTINVEKKGEHSNALGIYSINNPNITNEGTINVGGDNNIGIYANSQVNKENTEPTMSIVNNGTVSLGSNGIGIYAINPLLKQLDNNLVKQNGSITIGDSADNLHSIGIYLEGAKLLTSDNVSNETNKISVGLNGYGVFANKGSSIDSLGTIIFTNKDSSENTGIILQDSSMTLAELNIDNTVTNKSNNTVGIYYLTSPESVTAVSTPATETASTETSSTTTTTPIDNTPNFKTWVKFTRKLGPEDTGKNIAYILKDTAGFTFKQGEQATEQTLHPNEILAIATKPNSLITFNEGDISVQEKAMSLESLGANVAFGENTHIHLKGDNAIGIYFGKGTDANDTGERTLTTDTNNASPIIQESNNTIGVYLDNVQLSNSIPIAVHETDENKITGSLAYKVTGGGELPYR